MKKTTDTPFLLVVCALVTFGLLIFTSAALGLLAHGSGASFTSVAVGQLLFGLLMGGVALMVFSHIDYRLWKPYTPYFFAGAVILTLLTFVPHIGLALKGAHRWIALGGFSFQPEEILKLATIMFLAAWYSARYNTVNTVRGGVVPLLAIAGGAALILLVQPNTAGVIVLGLSASAMLFAAGGRVSHFLILCTIGIGAIVIAALIYPHVAERIRTYADQSADPQGSGYQIQQSLIAVGSGRLTGRGFGQGIEKFSFLPEPIGDSIFAVAAEEFGFIGSVLLVILFAGFCMLGLRIAARTPDPFGGLLVVGLTVLIVGQSFFNISSTLGLVPLIGVPLIFVSHGGTALAMALAEVGIILSVSRRMKTV